MVNPVSRLQKRIDCHGDIVGTFFVQRMDDVRARNCSVSSLRVVRPVEVSVVG